MVLPQPQQVVQIVFIEGVVAASEIFLEQIKVK
jgi:hypothetical protein